MSVSESGVVSVAFLSEDTKFVAAVTDQITAQAPVLKVSTVASTWYELVSTSAFPCNVLIVDRDAPETVPFHALLRVCNSAKVRVVLLSSMLPAGPVPFGVDFVWKTDSPDRIVGSLLNTLGIADPRPTLVEKPQYVKPKLSVGEERALSLYATGKSTAKIADEMNVGFETAKTYLRRVRAKYAGVDRPASRKAELMRRAMEDGLVS